MTRRLLPALLLVAAVIGGVKAFSCYSESIGARDAKIAALSSTVAALQKSTARTDTVYRVDTMRFTKWKTNYDTLRDTVLTHLTDTLRIKEYVHVTDSTIAACSAVVLTCEQRVAQRDSIIDLQGLRLKAERGRDRILGIKLPSRTTMFLSGAVAGFLLRR